MQCSECKIDILVWNPDEKPLCTECQHLEEEARIAKRREYFKEYRAKKAETYKEQQAQYRAKNREKAREYAKAYRKEKGKVRRQCNACREEKPLSAYYATVKGTCKACLKVRKPKPRVL